MAADDVAAAVGEVAVGAPLNGTVEIGGPEQFRFDDLIRQGLRAADDPREVVADPHARYFGAELSERSLVPGDGAQLGATRFDDWLSQQAPGGDHVRRRHGSARAHAATFSPCLEQPPDLTPSEAVAYIRVRVADAPRPDGSVLVYLPDGTGLVVRAQQLLHRDVG